MSDIHINSISTKSADEMDTDELLRNLGRFPSPVLPIGLLRELQSRGKAIHEPLVALVDSAIDSVGDGLGSEPDSIFFAFALLVPIATKDDQPRIDSLLTLPEKSRDHLLGDLSTEALPSLISRFFQDQSASKVIGWIDGVADHPKLSSFDAYPLFRGMSLAVAKGHLDRTIAIDAFINRLRRRADLRDDTQSSQVVCELMDLSASDVEAADATVRLSFGRGQIDLDYVGVDSWDDIDRQGRFRGDEKLWSDPAAELSTWCYDFVSDDLDPVDATYRINERANRSSFIEQSSISGVIDQLRKSTDEHFPRDFVESIDLAFVDAYHATIDLIREEVARYQVDSETWSGNGAYLGLVLTIANEMPLPTDLLQTILRLPQADREQIFGDQFGLIVQSVAQTPMRQHDFIENWIWDTDRSDPDRREMVEYYLRACHHSQLNREVAVEALVGGPATSLAGRTRADRASCRMPRVLYCQRTSINVGGSIRSRRC